MPTDDTEVDQNVNGDAIEERLPDHYHVLAAYYAYRLITADKRVPWSILSGAEKRLWMQAVAADNALTSTVVEAGRARRKEEIDMRLKALHESA
jgi:hypothetical protein